MEKMKFETEELSQKNIEKIGKLFPNCITEVKNENGELKKAINFETLKQMLSNDVVEDGEEHYEFTWVGKKKAMVEANKPIRKTLRPYKEESKDWDNTENLYIEGDNLEVLKLLQESYLNSIKMIYIDPPYNTGNDFIYNDDFKMTSDEYKDESGEIDEEGNRLFKNTDTNGRFHSDWCSMMYSRLMIARNLLSDDGVIFISIDDNEQENLKKICDEILGQENFIGNLIWEKKKKGSFLSKSLTNVKEYILVYSKNIRKFEGLISEINSDEETYPCINAGNKRDIRYIPAGIESKYKEKDFILRKGSIISNNTMDMVLHSDLIIKNGILAEKLEIEGNWRYSQKSMNDFANNKELYLTRDLYLRRIVNEIRYKTIKDILPRIGDNKETSYKENININNLNLSGWGSNEDGDEELRHIFNEKKIMDYPKPERLIFKLLSSYRKCNDSIVLDFFSGSATTAHAVMDLNAKDGGNRKFIMVQLPEECDEKSEVYKAGYKNICEIGKERIRRAGEKIKDENSNKEGIDNLDIGFRVLKVDSTNMKDVYYSPSEYIQDNLFDLESNIKEDRTDLDLLFGCLIEWGIPLNRVYESKNIAGTTVHIYNDGDLMACFDDNISQEAIKEIAKLKPLRVVFRDSSFETSAQKINVEEIFKLLSPETSLRVI